MIRIIHPALDWRLISRSAAALRGVSPKDAALLQEAFGIKTVSDLGHNKFFIAAQLMLKIEAFFK